MQNLFLANIYILQYLTLTASRKCSNIHLLFEKHFFKIKLIQISHIGFIEYVISIQTAIYSSRSRSGSHKIVFYFY